MTTLLLHNSTMKKLILSFCCLSAVSFLHAQQTPVFELPFSSGTVRMEVSADPLKNMKAGPAELVNNRYYRYIRFAKLPSKENRTALEKSGIRLLHYIAANTYAASVAADAGMLGERKNDILGFYTIEPIYKMHRELSDAIAQSSFPAFAANSSGSIGITFTYYEDIPHQVVIDLLTAAKTEISYQNKNSHRITVWIRGENIPAFVGQSFVCAAELKDDQPVHDNNVGRTNHRDNWMAQDHSGGRYYNGSGVNVMLQDDGLIGPHIDYTGRLQQQYVTFNAGNHGDHCAGIIMGGGNRDPLTRGMGWGANLYVYEASPYQGFDSIYSHYNSNNIVITSTSYSDGCNAGYTTLAQTLDQQIYDMPNLIHVFSAGNAGTSDCSYGAGSGWGNVTGGHKHSKNSIAVGNLDYIDAIASSSSRGPVHDGRMKPEVCAVGTNVYSTVDENVPRVQNTERKYQPAIRPDESHPDEYRRRSRQSWP
ncbi:MAG: subtilisin-like serine protease [Bacteroidetes bacterium]|nr:MAG: subtilisin-like serine protease [Bacteroidota bacterium]